MGSWSQYEVDQTVADYFEMLVKELTGKPFSKSETRSKLGPKLNARSNGSIEFKRQNISAVLQLLCCPNIKGYKPRWNYQRLLQDRIIVYLNGNQQLFDIFDKFPTKKVEAITENIDFSDWLVKPPVLNEAILHEPKALYLPTVSRNYIEEEQRNKSIGDLGEEYALDYEKWYLTTNGLSKLAKEVVWASKEEGDGLGYDIRSKNANGSYKFIEVKTTQLGKETPIFFSKNENKFSIKEESNFFLYRVFDVLENPKMFQKQGSFDRICRVEPIEFKGYF